MAKMQMLMQTKPYPSP